VQVCVTVSISFHLQASEDQIISLFIHFFYCGKMSNILHKVSDKLHLHRSNKDEKEASSPTNTVSHETVTQPAIIDERVRVDKVVEVQPVVHREIDQPVIHHVEKHITEAPAPNMGGVFRAAPVVEESVHRHVVEEVQPVIHREVSVPQVQRVEEHITEHVAAPSINTYEVQR